MTNEEIMFMLPVILSEFLLAVLAVRHIVTHKNYRFGDRTMWLIVTICVGYVGPLIYFVFGREKSKKRDI